MIPDPLQALACAKILVMLDDLTGKSYGYSTARQHYRESAHRWFFGETKSDRRELEWWCDTAGLEVDCVRAMARKVMEIGRAPDRKPRRAQKPRKKPRITVKNR